MRHRPVFTPQRLILATMVLALLCPAVPAAADEIWSGRRIMVEVLRRHELFPYVYEDQTMILTDRAGHRDVRKLRRFSRVEADGTVKFLLVFDSPSEVRGVALLATRTTGGEAAGGIYLPAFGRQLTPDAGRSRGSHFMGTDFSLEDLTAEVLPDFRYVRIADRKIEKTDCFVVEALPRDAAIEKATGYGLRRHFIQKDIFFIVQTDYYDPRGRFLKRMTRRDLKRVDRDMWRADMILMDNHKERHQSLIKINRRVFSHDYVPAAMFTEAWLLDNRHVMDGRGFILKDLVPSPGTRNGDLTRDRGDDTGQDPKNGSGPVPEKGA